jgi:hypothetical protein
VKLQAASASTPSTGDWHVDMQAALLLLLLLLSIYVPGRHCCCCYPGQLHAGQCSKWQLH